MRLRWSGPAVTFFRSLAWLLLPVLILASLVFLLMHWPARATVNVDLVVRGMRFRIHSDEQTLVERTQVRFLAVRGFREISLPRSDVLINDPANYDLKRDTYTKGQWKSLPLHESLQLRPTERHPATITIRPAPEQESLLTLDQIHVQSGTEISMSSAERDNLTMRLRGIKQSGTVRVQPAFELVTDACQGNTPAWPSGYPSLTLRVQLRGPGHLLQFSAADSGVSVALEFPSDHREAVLKTDIAVDSVEFLEQEAAGQRTTAVSGPGSITFEDYPTAAPVKLRSGDFVMLDDVRNFLLRRIEFSDNRDDFRVHLYGIASRVRSGPTGYVRSRGITRLDQLWWSPAVVKVFTALALVVPFLIGFRRLIKDFVGW
jgi:hypothetical protein